MRHPTEGVLRRLLDEPAGVSEPDRRHVAGCPRCSRALTTVREDSTAVGAALQAPATADLDVDRGWRRLSRAASVRHPRRTAPAPLADGFVAALRRPVVAVLVVVVVLTGAGTAAARDWLPIFRTEQVAPVGLSSADLIALPDLSAYGELALTGEPDVHEVPDAATAAAESGLDVPQVTTLARGISGDPTYQVGGQMSATFTFSAERAARAAADTGTPLPPTPPGLDGSSVRLAAGPGVVQLWSSSAGVPALVVGRAVAPKAFSSGVPFATVRDYLLSLPGLPADVAAQLRTFTADGSTLPLPVPADEVSTSAAQVNGIPATLLATHDRALAALVWVDQGEVTVVAGSLDADELLVIARDLR